MARKSENTDLLSIIEILEITSILNGERICITGHLSAPRKDIEKIINQAGGLVHKDVHYDTTILVSNSDWTSTTIGVDKDGKKKSTKMMKAERNNKNCFPDRPRTKIMTENEFLQMLIERSQSSQMSA